MQTNKTLGKARQAAVFVIAITGNILKFVFRAGRIVLDKSIAALRVFLKGGLVTSVFMVLFTLMAADPKTTTFGEFLGAIQSPVFAAFATLGGVAILMFQIIRSRVW